MTSLLTGFIERIGKRTLASVLIVAAVLVGGAVAASAYVHTGRSGHRSNVVPQNAAMELQLGVRFSRVAVVADGGLITLSYVVLDSEKAGVFELSISHPPVLYSESRHLSTKRVALMKQGHVLRPGQTYYLVYQNSRGAVRSGERVTIVDGAFRLEHVPVL